MQWWANLGDSMLADRYRLEGKIGEGGMAEVFVARQMPLGRKVAIKVPKLGDENAGYLVKRFRQEVERQNQERIVGVVGLLDAGEWVGGDGVTRPYLVMEYVSGGSLAGRLGGGFGGRDHAQGIEEVLAWLAPVALTLDRLHGRGLLHRDVKPDNILFNTDGDPLLSDFGIATTLDTGPGGVGGASTGLWVVGSPGYMSPECVSSQKTPASDQFSLGITVYEALTCRLPVVPTSFAGWIQALGNWHPKHLSCLCPELPRGVADAVMRAIETRGEDRFPTCSAFANRVREALAERPAPAHATDAQATTVMPAEVPQPARQDDAESWHYVAADGQQQGPISQQELRQRFASGRLDAASLVWSTGMPQWREYASLFGQETPPRVPRLPGAPAVPAASVAVAATSAPGAAAATLAVAATAQSQLPSAGFGMRFSARLIDLLAVALPLIVVDKLADKDGYDGIVTTASFIWLGVLVAQAWLLAQDGQTLGKKILGTRVVSASDGGNPGFVRTVLVRELVFWALLFPGGLIFGIPPLVDWLLFFRADRRCGHDHLAGTRVVTGAAS
ncbi:MAG: RDD family protein [Proteobacteria bacterium]|nr:RDD family protein [Pseudomonadota bacterium]